MRTHSKFVLRTDVSAFAQRTDGFTTAISHMTLAALLASVFVFGGCASWSHKPTEPTITGSVGEAEGQWTGRAFVKNLKNGQSGALTLEIVAKEPSQLRLEAMASFGTHVASIALNGDEVRTSLTREKRFIVSPADVDALARLVPIKIPPRALLALLFDRPFDSRDWKCEFEGSAPRTCTHRSAGVKIDWLDRADHARRLSIRSRDAEIEMSIRETQSKVGTAAGVFELEAPSGYKVERL